MSDKVGHTEGSWELAPRAKATIRSVAGKLICDVHWVNRDANARLIAAAHDLLAALKAMIEPYNGFSLAEVSRRVDVPELDRIAQARAVIRRAEEAPR